MTISLLLDQLNNDDNDCDDEEGENENEDDETAMKEETELEVVPRDAKNNNEGKIFKKFLSEALKTLWIIKIQHPKHLHSSNFL